MDDDNAVLEPKCFLLGRPCFPCHAMNLFWKVTIGTTAVLMLVFSLTLWLMANSMNKYATEIREVRAELGYKVDAVSNKIDGHKQLTMDNRVMTSEIRGMLTGWIEERRREIIKKHPDWQGK